VAWLLSLLGIIRLLVHIIAKDHLRLDRGSVKLRAQRIRFWRPSLRDDGT
jgi:hypothetical protein